MNIIDFHAHILPAADHGSDSLETTKAQIQLAESYGIVTVVATPHFYPHVHSIEAFKNRKDKAFSELKNIKSDIRFISGAEVLLCENLNKLTGIESLVIGDTNVILLELPFSNFRNEYVRTTEELISSGYDIVLAHADRYPPASIESMLLIGAKIQLNASSLSTLFVKRYIRDWIDRDVVWAIGSDIHGADESAYKRYKKARLKLKKDFEKIMYKSEKLLNI